MAKQRLFPEHKYDDDQPHERFNRLAAKILQIPKVTLDEREKEWKSQKKTS